MDKRTILFVVAVTFLSVSVFTPALYAEEPIAKFSRGAINTTTGWTELPLQMANQSSENLYQGMTYGFMDGLSMGLKRTMYGVWDFVTFPVPPYDKPVLEPETVFEPTSDHP